MDVCCGDWRKTKGALVVDLNGLVVNHSYVATTIMVFYLVLELIDHILCGPFS